MGGGGGGYTAAVGGCSWVAKRLFPIGGCRYGDFTDRAGVSLRFVVTGRNLFNAVNAKRLVSMFRSSQCGWFVGCVARLVCRVCSQAGL